MAILWFTAIALAVTDVYALYSAVKEDPRIWTTGESAVFWSLKWSIWSVCIIWLIFACHYNYAGWCEIYFFPYISVKLGGKANNFKGLFTLAIFQQFLLRLSFLVDVNIHESN